MMMMTTAMKTVLPGVFLLLSSSTVSALGSVLLQTIVPIQHCSSWQDAQMYCRSSFSDLTVLYKQSDVDSMCLDQYFAWVGLKNIGVNWVWVDGGNLDIHSNLWSQGNQTNLVGGCAYVSYQEKRFSTTDCGDYYYFICFTNTEGKKYTFINQSKTWLDAQAYCTSFNYDLADIHDDGDMNAAVNEQDFPVWTGLYREGGMWKWSTGVSDYRNWAPNQPGNDGDCVAIYSSSKTMITQNCSTRYPFVCFVDNLIVVKENKTWEEAMNYCKAIMMPNRGPYQLVSVQPGDYSYMMNRVMEADTEEVWTGLRFLAGNWVWVNGADILLSDLPLCPLSGYNCGAFSKNDTGSLLPCDCLEEKNFLCYSQW